MIEEAMGKAPALKHADKKADVTMTEMTAIYDQVIRVSENAQALKAINAMIVKNSAISSGLVRLLELVEEDIEEAADVLNGLV